MRNKSFVTFALCCAAAACGGEKAPAPSKPAAETPKPAAPAEAPKPPETPKPAEPAPPAPAPAPAARETKDANGHDWASHMGDIAFTFDSSAAAGRSEKERRALMLYFTSPS